MKIIYLLFYSLILCSENCLAQEQFLWTTSPTGEQLPKGVGEYGCGGVAFFMDSLTSDIRIDRYIRKDDGRHFWIKANEGKDLPTVFKYEGQAFMSEKSGIIVWRFISGDNYFWTTDKHGEKLNDKIIKIGKVREWKREGEAFYAKYDHNEKNPIHGIPVYRWEYGAGLPNSCIAPPQPLPKLTVNFTAAPNSIQIGNSSVLSWTVNNSNTITIDNGIGNIATTGSVTVKPTTTTTYTLTAMNEKETSHSIVTVTVKPVPQPPLCTEAKWGFATNKIGDVNSNNDCITTGGANIYKVALVDNKAQWVSSWGQNFYEIQTTTCFYCVSPFNPNAIYSPGASLTYVVGGKNTVFICKVLNKGGVPKPEFVKVKVCN
jgi:hypothetical protein